MYIYIIIYACVYIYIYTSICISIYLSIYLAPSQAMLEEEKHRYEHQASVAASEVKAALDAHGDFAEALEAEQRLIVERWTEQLTKEAAQRHELMKRLGVVEMDVQKAGDIRG